MLRPTPPPPNTFWPVPYFKLLANDICCSFQGFVAIALKQKKSYDKKLVIAQCTCINNTVILLLLIISFLGSVMHMAGVSE